MLRASLVQTNRLPKSHISFHLDNRPNINISRPTPVSKNRGTEKFPNKTSSLTSTLFIPSVVSFTWTGTKEGTELIFNSERGGIRFLIPSRFRCEVQKRNLNLGCDALHLYPEFRTLIGALYRAMLGVTKGSRKKLKTVGMGYKGGWEGNRLLKMVLGYSHPVHYFLTSTTKIKFSRKNNRFNLQGPNALIINQTAAELHLFKTPDVYKGKGVRYRGYKLLKKEGKKKK